MYEVFVLKGQSIKSFVDGADKNTYVATLRFGELDRKYEIPYRRHESDLGYQRKPTKKRVDDLARNLRSGIADLPTAVLLSLRDPNLEPKLDSSGRYILSLPNNGAQPFYVT